MSLQEFLKEFQVVKGFIKQNITTVIDTKSEFIREFGKDYENVISNLSVGLHSFGDDNIIYKVSEL